VNPDAAEYRRIIGRHLERGVERPVPEYTVCVSNEYNYHYFTHQGKVDVMNYSTAIFLINDEVRALYVIFEPDRQPEHKPQRYMVKTFDKDIKEGDYVVVPSTMGHKLAIALVTDTDAEVDFDSTTVLPWIVQRVDLTPFNHLVGQEDVAVAAIRQAHFVQKKKALASDLMESKELRRLPLASRKDDL
jgi:hypothetical protein